MCQPPYSVLKPLRYKVGGPSEVSPAAELHFAVCDRMDTNRVRVACWVLAHSLPDAGWVLAVGLILACWVLDADCSQLAEIAAYGDAGTRIEACCLGAILLMLWLQHK